MKRQRMLKIDIAEAKAALLDGFCNALNGAEDLKEGVEEMITARDAIDLVVKTAAAECKDDQEADSDLITINMKELKADLFDGFAARARAAEADEGEDSCFVYDFQIAADLLEYIKEKAAGN